MESAEFGAGRRQMRNRTKKKPAARPFELLGLVGGAVVFLAFLVMMALH
jgi:hypothetical protein